MVNSVYKQQYENFQNDKSAFFCEVRKNRVIVEDHGEIVVNDLEELQKEQTRNKLSFANERVDTLGFGFLTSNKLLIEQEFNQLFATLKQRGAKTDEFWFYCYYCCLMLKTYYDYDGYDQESKLKEYADLLEPLKEACLTGNFPTQPLVSEDSFFTALGKKIAADLADLIDTPRKLSKIRNKVAISNLNRIYWFFCRTTVKNSLLLARDLQWLEKIGNFLGKEIDVDNFIHSLESPNGALRLLSVGFFAIRFIMNAGMVVKHTAFPTAKEKQLDWNKRFSNEIYKRHAVFLNDIVWGTVNCLTNYNEVFGISAPVAGWAVAGFMFFDVCLILWRRQLEEKEYLTKRSQYLTESGQISALLRGELTSDKRKKLDEQLLVTTEQLRQLENSWKASDATYLFNASAALLLMAGFSSSMLLTPPVMVFACYVVCTFAVAMYLSDGAYKEYKEKSILLEHATLIGKGEQAALRQYNTAMNDFIFTMTKNTVLPTLLIATFAVCWQASLFLAVAYVGYELYRSYDKHQQAKMDASEPENGIPLLT